MMKMTMKLAFYCQTCSLVPRAQSFKVSRGVEGKRSRLTAISGPVEEKPLTTSVGDDMEDDEDDEIDDEAHDDLLSALGKLDKKRVRAAGRLGFPHRLSIIDSCINTERFFSRILSAHIHTLSLSFFSPSFIVAND